MKLRGRRVAAGVAALAGVIAAVLLLRRDAGQAPPPEPLPADPAAAPAAPAVAEVSAAPGPSAEVAPAAALPPEWRDVPVAGRVSDLGPGLARDVYDGLQRAQAATRGCFEEAARAEARQPAGGRPQPDEMGPPIVTLLLEARDGELVVVGVPLQELGGGTLRLVECCEGVLRGFRIPARNAVAGRRYRLQHELL